jgi:hypothetical protein
MRMPKALLFAFGILLASQVHANSFLVMGDSHTVGTFGTTLDTELRLISSSVQTYGSCGSIIGWWYSGQSTPCGYRSVDETGKVTSALSYPTPLIQALLSSKPDTVVIAMGSNYAVGYGDAQIKTEIRKLLADVKANAPQCIWVGPPDMRKLRSSLAHLVDLIRAEVSSDCTFIDSREFTHYAEQEGDGIHYETPSMKPIAVEWAKSVRAKIESSLQAE